MRILIPPSAQFTFNLLAVSSMLGYVTLVGGGLVGQALFQWQLVTFALSAAVFGGWLIWRGALQHVGWPLTGVEWALGGAALAGGLSLAASADQRIGQARLSELAGYAALFYLAVDLLSSGLQRRLLSGALVIVSGFGLALGVLEIYGHYLGRWSELLTQPPYRLASMLGHANLLAGLVNLALPFVALQWRQSRKAWVRTGLILWLMCYLVVQPFASSRGGLVGLVVILGALAAWRRVRRRGLASSQRMNGSAARRGWAMPAGLVIAALGLAGLFVFQSLHPSHGGVFDSRLYIWRAAAQVAASHPWLGAGPGRFGFEAARYFSIPPQFWPVHAHSVLWQVVGEFGLIGLLALFSLLFAFSRAGWRSIKSAARDNGVEVVFASAGLLGYAAQNLVDDLTHVAATMVPLMLVLAMVVAAAPLKRSRLPLAAMGLPLLIVGALQAQWLWAYAAFDGARRAYNAGDSQRAMVLAQEAARRDPSFAFYDVEAGLLAGRLGQWPSARTHLRRALSVESNLAFVHANLGVAQWQGGDPIKGLAELRAAFDLAPQSATIALTAGKAAEAAGQSAEAEKYYRAALALRPAWGPHPFWEAASLRARVRDEYFADTKAGPSDSAYATAQAAIAAGNPAEAGYTVATALSDPAIWPPHRLKMQMLFGEILLAEGDTAEAMNQFAMALAQFANPSIEGVGFTFWNTYGFGPYQRQPFPFDSVPGLQPLDVTPDMVSRFEQLLVWTWAQGDCPAARRAARQLLAVDPDNAVARSYLEKSCE